MKNFETLIFKCLLMIVLISYPVLSNKNEISGIVVNAENNEPLSGANVYFKFSLLGTITDDSGFFRIKTDLQLNKDTLIVNYLGYKEYRVSLDKFINNSVIKLYVDVLSLEKGIAVFAEKFDLGKQDVPHSAFVVDAQQIERYGTNEISDLFKTDPSVVIDGNDLDGRKIQIRGSDADEVNVYIDGILINNIGLDNTADLSVIPPANIKKMEILKGANLVLLGSGAFGGVVNITSHKKIEREYSVNFKYGNLNNRFVAAEINTSIIDNIFLNYYGSVTTLSPDVELFPSERLTEKTTSEEIRTAKQNHHLTLFYIKPKSQYMFKMIGYLLDYTKPDWENQRKNLMMAGAYKGGIFGIDNFDISLNYLFNDDLITRAAPRDASYLSTFLSQRSHLKIAKNMSSSLEDDSGLNFQVVTEYFHDELFNKSEVEINNITSRLYNGYLYDNRANFGGVLSFANKMNESGSMRWNTFAGLRSEFLANGRQYNVTTFGVEVTSDQVYWKVSPYFNYGDNIKIPTLQDNAYLLHLRNLAASQEGLDPIKLIPENNTSYEIGVNYQYTPSQYYFESIEANFALYSNRVYNKLLKTQKENIIVERQIGQVQNKGIEATVKMNQLFSNTNLAVSYGLLDVDNVLLYAYKPEQKLSISADYASPFGFYCNSVLFFEGKSVAWEYNDQNAIEVVEINPFYDVDFTVGYNFKINPVTIGVKFSGYNIFDNAGFQFYYLKKRFYQAGLSLQY